MENPIKEVTIVDNILKITDNARLPSEFSVDTPIVTIEFTGMREESSSNFRDDCYTVYTFEAYNVTVGKTTKTTKSNKEVTKLTKEINGLNKTIDSMNDTLKKHEEAAKENVAAMNAAIKEADELRTALETIKENDELGTLNKQNAALMEEIDRLRADIVRLTNESKSDTDDAASGD